ncbi:MAG: cell division FtsA domain-containing protein [Pseudomonadaceae bacterium]|nr:cell division FtsA domain-containing protein [Pseudomonadaceae bacterium]
MPVTLTAEEMRRQTAAEIARLQGGGEFHDVAEGCLTAEDEARLAKLQAGSSIAPTEDVPVEPMVAPSGFQGLDEEAPEELLENRIEEKKILRRAGVLWGKILAAGTVLVAASSLLSQCNKDVAKPRMQEPTALAKFMGNPLSAKLAGDVLREKTRAVPTFAFNPKKEPRGPEVDAVEARPEVQPVVYRENPPVNDAGIRVMVPTGEKVWRGKYCSDMANDGCRESDRDKPLKAERRQKQVSSKKEVKPEPESLQGSVADIIGRSLGR